MIHTNLYDHKKMATITSSPQVSKVTTRRTYNVVFIDHFFYLCVGVQFIHKLKI